jgi:hypothetical protein
MFVSGRKKQAFVAALWILIVGTLVLVPKFVVSRSSYTQTETSDPIVAGSKRYVPPC